MSLFVLGINHKTAPVALREQVAFSSEKLEEAYRLLCEQTSCDEAVILSTCNRTELYCAGESLDCVSMKRWLSEYHQVNLDDIEQQSYVHSEEQAVAHLIRVAAGLDSMVLGEPQIFGQLKQAYSHARQSGVIRAVFEKLFQHGFASAKKIRTETEIGANAVSVAFAAVQLAKHIFARLTNSTVLLIGAGETIELVGRHLKEQNVKNILVANRTLQRAQDVASQLGAEELTLAQVPKRLADADIVISSTASQLPILGKGVVETALKERRHKPMLLLDIAVPRDIEPEVAELDDAYLYSVDDLQQIVEQNRANREDAAREAEAMLQTQVAQFVQWSRAQSSIDALLEYRQQAEHTKQRILQRATKQLEDGKPAEAVMDELATKLTNALIHAPTQAIKMAAEQQDKKTEQLLRQALGLTDK